MRTSAAVRLPRPEGAWKKRASAPRRRESPSRRRTQEPAGDGAGGSIQSSRPLPAWKCGRKRSDWIRTSAAVRLLLTRWGLEETHVSARPQRIAQLPQELGCAIWLPYLPKRPDLPDPFPDYPLLFPHRLSRATLLISFPGALVSGSSAAIFSFCGADITTSKGLAPFSRTLLNSG